MGLSFSLSAKEIVLTYEKPGDYQHQAIYEALKANHKDILGESVQFLSHLYSIESKIKIVVKDCGSVNSSYQEHDYLIVICYESLYNKIYDYPDQAPTAELFVNRVFQNVMFTFWHEMGHALMHQFNIESDLDIRAKESLADEFAVLSMLWRSGKQWKDVLVMSALHFNNKSKNNALEYLSHESDADRCHTILCLLYGFAPKSYARLLSSNKGISLDADHCQSYYLERAEVWKNYLREHTKRSYF